MKKLLVLLASSAEWYEFTIYSFCAGYIGAAFFPATDPFVSFLAAFGALAAGFLARPFGGIIFGYIGDTKSRSSALAWAAFFMGVPTVGIAFLPGYATLGILAPALLVMFRIIQGIAIGGQYSGSVVILVESETTMIGKAKASANVIASSFGGILLAILSFQAIRYFIPEEFMAQGGWRILFAIAILLVVLSFFIKHMGDEKSDDKPKVKTRLPTMIAQNFTNIIFVMLLCFPGAVVAYFLLSILPNVIKEVLLDKTTNIELLTTISLILFIVICQIAARLVKYFNIKTVIASGLVLMLILPIPMYSLYKVNSEMLIYFFVVMSVVFGMFYGCIMVIFAESFPKEIRYSGFALAYNIGFGIYGGLRPLVCLYLAHNYSDYVPVWIICISAVVGLITLYTLEPKCCKQVTSQTE
jgi:MHS family proline/betaine transporter-like MFS transporter